MSDNSRESSERTRFLATTIHEIRTPIQTIIGTLELLSETKLDKEQSEYLRQVKFSADVLLNLANDVLDLSKLQSGKFNIEIIPFNVAQTAEQVMDLICIEAHNRGLEIITDIDYSLPLTIMGDPTRTQQIILNLVKNAVKFTKKGYVQLCVSYNSPDSTLLFEIRDSGIGI
ncbi:MAG TPA: histidine kinase dimerization/phospho-acceptor domain-containing protein, partial [Treponemataceae bacterium]|nr:histidine kinase dimerization/phospho-acceptor domain-containing protein [Treponemataceae bacterium]